LWWCVRRRPPSRRADRWLSRSPRRPFGTVVTPATSGYVHAASDCSLRVGVPNSPRSRPSCRPERRDSHRPGSAPAAQATTSPRQVGGGRHPARSLGLTHLISDLPIPAVAVDHVDVVAAGRCTTLVVTIEPAGCSERALQTRARGITQGRLVAI
jgi:hypothetical protein